MNTELISATEGRFRAGYKLFQFQFQASFNFADFTQKDNKQVFVTMGFISWSKATVAARDRVTWRRRVSGPIPT